MSGPRAQVAAGVSGSQPSSVPAGPGPHAHPAACAAWGPGRVAAPAPGEPHGDGGTVPGSTGLFEGIVLHSPSCVCVCVCVCVCACAHVHTQGSVTVHEYTRR